MKKVLTLVMTMLILITSVSVFAEDAYMGFSVSEEWFVFSRDMKDESLLQSIDMSASRVNEILENSGSDYLLINPSKNRDIYVKVESTDLSYEYFNLKESTDEHLMQNLRELVYDAFLLKGFNYNDAGVVITDYPQMKFVTVPGNTFYDDGKKGILFGGTIVNGKAIGFTMYLDSDEVTDEDVTLMQEVASTVTFTVIKDKSEVSPQKVTEEKSQSAFEFMVGGFGAIVVIIICVYVIERMRHKDEDEQEEIQQEEKIEQ